MKGISTIIATIVLLLITIALAGTAYMFFSGVFTGKTLGVFDIMSVNENSILIRNSGTEIIDQFSTVIVDGNAVDYLMSKPSNEIAPGEVTTINLYTLLDKKQYTAQVCTSTMCNTGYLTIRKGNVAPNPDFEWNDLGNGPPKGWNQESGTSEIVSDPYSGEKALYFPDGGTYHRIGSLYTIPVNPGQKIHGKLFYKSNGGNRLYFGLNYYGCASNSPYWNYFGSSYSNTGGVWTELSGTITIPTGKTCAHIWLFNYAGNSGPVWIDNVYVGLE